MDFVVGELVPGKTRKFVAIVVIDIMLYLVN